MSSLIETSSSLDTSATQQNEAGLPTGNAGVGFTPGPWVWSEFGRYDGKPLETAEDVAETVAYSARQSSVAKLYGVTLDDADENGRSTVVCYTGNGPRAQYNARLISLAPELVRLLDKALGYIANAAQGDVGYGFFPGGDPRNFSPDPECSEPSERENHRLACEAAEKGEISVQPDGQWVGPGLHVLKCQFGMGTYTMPDERAERLLKRCEAALKAAYGDPSSAATVNSQVGTPATETRLTE